MKRYTNRESIIKDIDAAHRKIAKAKLVAQTHLDAEKLLTGSNDLTELRIHREAADKQFRKIKRLENVRLPKLGEKLAEFDTVDLIPISEKTSAEDLVKAHQYLYYVELNPVWTDFEYDKFCKENGISGIGGNRMLLLITQKESLRLQIL